MSSGNDSTGSADMTGITGMTGITSTDDANERDSQLSAMYDGELSAGECELVARRLSRDENLRQSWANYALIGTVMRSEALANRELAPRVLRSLAPDTQSHRESPPRMPRWAVPASGLGLAAGVAVVGVFGVLWLGSASREPVSTASMLPPVSAKGAEIVIPAQPVERMVAANTAPKAKSTAAAASDETPAGNGEPLSYVTPPVNSGSRAATFGVELAGYVGAHSAVSAPMLRHSAISAVIAAEAPGSVEESLQIDQADTAAAAAEAVR